VLRICVENLWNERRFQVPGYSHSARRCAVAGIMWPCGNARTHAVPATDVTAKIVTLWVAGVRTIATSGLDGFVFVQFCYRESVLHCNLLLYVVKMSGIVLGHAHSIPGDVCIYIHCSEHTGKILYWHTHKLSTWCPRNTAARRIPIEAPYGYVHCGNAVNSSVPEKILSSARTTSCKRHVFARSEQRALCIRISTHATTYKPRVLKLFATRWCRRTELSTHQH